jgi:hypothetical protein
VDDDDLANWGRRVSLRRVWMMKVSRFSSSSSLRLVSRRRVARRADCVVVQGSLSSVYGTRWMSAALSRARGIDDEGWRREMRVRRARPTSAARERIV